MLNQVALVGRLTADVELRTTQSGLNTATFTVAVTRDRKNQEGKYDSDFIRVVAWRQTAEYLANYGSKGALVSVSGRIQTGSYTNQQGMTIYTTDVVADSVNLIESRATREQHAQQQPMGQQAQIHTGQAAPVAQSQPVAQQGLGGPQITNGLGGGLGAAPQPIPGMPQATQQPAQPVAGKPMNISDDDLPF
jgi:single-strand DNA-binding protein